MNIKKALLPFIPSPVLRQYRRIKRYFVSKYHKFKPTGNNIAEIKRIQLNKAFITEKQADSVQIVQYLNWDNPFNTSDYGKYQFLEKEYKVGDDGEIEIGFNNYGSWTLEIHYYKGNRIVAKEVRTVKVEAPEYNIAYLSATLPVIFLLFRLWGISKKNSPTIVGLERNLFNYDNLPENVYPFPIATTEELATPYKGFNGYFQRLVFYIGSLYKMNPDAKFNLYLCDHFAYLALSLLYANRIPENNFHIYLLGDGVGSYECFNYLFRQKTAEEIYKEMKKTWEMSKRLACETGIQQRGKESFLKCGNPCMSETVDSKNETEKFSYGFSFAYVLAIENENIEWILHYPEKLKGDPKVLSCLVKERICKINFIDGIRSLAEHKSELINMINIDYSIFSRSHETGKKICMFLGAYQHLEADMKYIDATISYFGEEYDYYYKEHPRRPVDIITWRKEFEKRGIVFLDPKIPTEIYMMIEPGICLAGCLSSTFLSVDLLRNQTEQILSIWDKTDRRIKTNCLEFISKVAMNIEDNSVKVYDR